MIRRPPRSTRTDTLFPYTTLFRSLTVASMNITKPFASTLDLIGNTPLVLLAGPSEEAGCEIWGKCEFANPGSSVKDRAALYIIRDADRKSTRLNSSH